MSSLFDPWVITIVVLVIVILLALAIVYGRRAHRRKVTAGREDLVGRTAEARTVLNPKGTVFVEGEHWSATSDGERIEPGEEVIITRVDNLKLWVSNQKKGGK